MLSVSLNKKNSSFNYEKKGKTKKRQDVGAGEGYSEEEGMLKEVRSGQSV